MPAEHPCQTNEVVGEKVEVLENKENQTGRYDADYEQPAAGPASCVLQENTCRVVDDDGDSQDEDIRWNKGHVKHATGHQQMERAQPMWQQKVDRRDNREKNRKLK